MIRLGNFLYAAACVGAAVFALLCWHHGVRLPPEAGLLLAFLAAQLSLDAIRRLLLAILVLIVAAPPTAARWKPEYAQASPEVRDWYKAQELTPAAQLRFHFKSCCDNSDRVKTRFAVSKLSGADQWFYQLPDGTWREVPPDIIHWDKHAPGGEPVLFAFQGQPTCFFPPDGGI